MMPLIFADLGKDYTIQRIGGNPSVKKHLEDMGFVADVPVRVGNSVSVGLIVALALVALICFQLFRPYKEATTLTEEVKVSKAK